MNLQTHIKPELWRAISSTYQAQNYSHAILDAMHYLSDVLREKSGADGDGNKLVGEALGGDSPRLRINKLQTETEKNVQKGLTQILMGMYLAIRNPRSHEQAEDTQDTADAIIYFLNYTLTILDQSLEPFTIEGFLSRVFDPYFVESDKYSELLVSEIPEKKRVDTLIAIYRNKVNGDGKKLKYIIKAILNKLSDNQVSDFLSVVSDELKTTQEDVIIRLTFQLVPSYLWPKINEVARLRIENKLAKCISEGVEYSDGKCNSAGALGTWTNDFIEHFSLRNQIVWSLIRKLQSDEHSEVRYAMNFFVTYLPSALDNTYQREACIAALSKVARTDNDEFRGQIKSKIYSFPEDWRTKLEENLKDLTNPDGSPFFSEDVSDIPF